MLARDNRIAWGEDENKIPQRKSVLHEVETNVAKSVVNDYTDGEKELTNLFGRSRTFGGPKPTTLIQRFCDQSALRNGLFCDFFAGSGTSGESVIKYNREKNTAAKFILVETGSHFNGVLVPRLIKITYAPVWQDGKPSSVDTGLSHCFKYLRLESYEDTLNNLALRRQNGLVDLFDPAGQEDYLLHYMLNVESQASLLSVEDFKKPFDYKLRIATDSAGACQTKAIDLVETFNYLLGLRVAHVDAKFDLGYLVVSGKLPNGQSCLIVWRDCDKLDYDGTAELFSKYKITPNDNEHDVVYINGDHNIPTIAQATEAEGGVTRQLTLRQIEPEFITRMFAGEEV
ncbi:MAG: restriction endonuclease subunit M [Verrucomicrobia bacterium]|nr:restriction endonuclease subunit M [Verrucomicrobiota bacterium]